MQRRRRRESQSKAEVGKDKNIVFTRPPFSPAFPSRMEPRTALRLKGFRAHRWGTRALELRLS